MANDELDYKKIYSEYPRPPLFPPPYIFGIVWPVLYLLIAISYGFVFIKFLSSDLTWPIIIPFIVNLPANLFYTFFQFKLKNFTLALLDILVILGTIVLTIILIWPYYHWVAYLQLPYLLWVLFATYLQISITILNHK